MSNFQSLANAFATDAGANFAPQIIEASVLCAFFATLAVAGRCVARWMQRQHCLPSDIILFVALPLQIASCSCVGWASSQGLGRHLVAVGPEALGPLLLSAWIAQMLYTIVLTLTKISVLCFYVEIFPGRSMQRGAWIVGAATVAWGIAGCGVLIGACKPVDGFWRPTMTPPPVCLDTNTFYISTSAFNIATDAAVLILPLRAVWRLQMRFYNKIAVSIIFMLGAGVIAASIARIVLLLRADLVDISFAFTGLAIMGMVEQALAIVGACVPTLKGPLRLLVPNFIKKRLSSYFTRASGPMPRRIGYTSGSSSGRTGKGRGVSGGNRHGTPRAISVSHSFHVSHGQPSFTNRHAENDSLTSDGASESAVQLVDLEKAPVVESHQVNQPNPFDRPSCSTQPNHPEWPSRFDRPGGLSSYASSSYSLRY